MERSYALDEAGIHRGPLHLCSCCGISATLPQVAVVWMDCVDPAHVGPLRAQLGRDREVHSQARAEVGLDLALCDEPRLLVELRGVRIPDH